MNCEKLFEEFGVVYGRLLGELKCSRVKGCGLVAMSKPGVPAEPILVGREKELEELHSLMNSAVEGKGKTVFVMGEAGSGKTRLAREFLNAAVKRGVAVMAGWCLSDAQVPFFPFMEAFNSYYAAYTEVETSTSPVQTHVQLDLGAPAQIGMEGGEREITSWLAGPKPAEKTAKPEMLSPQAWKDQVFAAVSRTLQTIAAQVPVVLFLEDIHWADSASLALLHYVARAIHDSERVLVLATFRSDELTSDAEGHPHPLAETLRMMRREELFTEITLQSLSQDNVSKMAENMIGGTLQTELAEKLATESKGNPLFVVESLRMLHERKSLLQENNQWRLTVDDFGIPSKIKDIILRRLACLKYTQRRVLDAASVIGEEFDVELLSTVLGQDSLDVLETLNVVAHSTSLVRVEEDHYRFDHARSRETLYEELSPPLKRGYHGRIAEKLENAEGTALAFSDLAYHFAEAGNKEKAVKYAVAAGKDEVARWSNAQAIKHFKYVLQNVPAGHVEEKRTALEGLGDAYAAHSMYEEAIKTFDELAASETGVVKLRALRKATDAAFAKGDKPDLLIAYAKKAEELGVNDRLEMARIINNRGHAWAWVGHGEYKQDLADYDAALKVFEEENSLADTAEAMRRSGLIDAAYDDLREKGLGELLRSVAIFREVGDVRKETVATLNLGEGFSISGLFQEERLEYANVLRIGENLGVFDELALASMYLSAFDEDDGNLAEALSRSLEALEYSKKTDASYIQGILYAALTRQYSLIGDLKQADEYFDKMNKLPPEVPSPHFIVQTAIAKGIYFAAKGQWGESDQVLEKFKEHGERIRKNLKSGFPGIEAFGAEAVAWVLEKKGRFEEARVLRDGVKRRLEQFEQQVEARFGHANVRLSVMVPRKVQVEEEFEIRLDLVNVGRKPGVVAKIGGAVPPEFKVSGLPSFCCLKDGSLEMKEKGIGPFQVETVKLQVNVMKAGSYPLNPEVFYVDDLGKTKAFSANPITITAHPAKPTYETLPGRIPTGYAELDKLLMGGIPEKYAVILSSPSIDERALLIMKFLEAGANRAEITFHVTVEAGSAKALAEDYPSNFFLLLCNPQADAIVQNLPNVFKLKGIESLTEIDIALTKMFRTLNPQATGPRRICIEIVSDALLQHHAVNTRRWLSALLPALKSKGFTVLTVINPQMHPPEESQAVRSLFDGEIAINEKETAKGPEKILRVRKLVNQKYLEDEFVLAKGKLSS
jgi:KaiC/GvpD/RAD55 family RecA-like ATPase/tetratricopeptide (TPR) repeat protein